VKVLTVIARILLGLIFVVFGSNAFLHFIPMPPLPQNLAGDYTRVFLASGYVYAIGGLQVIGGLLLLIGRFVPLGLTILGAIIVNILIFHALSCFSFGVIATRSADSSSHEPTTARSGQARLVPWWPVRGDRQKLVRPEPCPLIANWTDPRRRKRIRCTEKQRLRSMKTK